MVHAGLSVGTATDGAPRSAVVIGNAHYANLPSLRTAPDDARLVSGALRRIGFDVVLMTNADSRVMSGLFAKLPLLFDPDGIGLLYYSGYAAQADGANYLLPTDNDPRTKQQLLETAFALGAVSERAQLAGLSFQLLVLDASRPEAGFSAIEGIDSALAPPRVTVEDVFVMYSTAPGTTSSPVTSRTSPFANAFAAAIEQAGLGIVDVFRLVRMRVRESTNGAQIPWTFASLVGDVVLNPITGARPAPGALITSCDLLAADPKDADRVAPPVSTESMDALTALRECELAVLAEPDNPRQLFQFARTIETVGTSADALALYRSAATSGYAAAAERLAELGAR